MWGWKRVVKVKIEKKDSPTFQITQINVDTTPSLFLVVFRLWSWTASLIFMEDSPIWAQWRKVTYIGYYGWINEAAVKNQGILASFVILEQNAWYRLLHRKGAFNLWRASPKPGSSLSLDVWWGQWLAAGLWIFSTRQWGLTTMHVINWCCYFYLSLNCTS